MVEKKQKKNEIVIFWKPTKTAVSINNYNLARCLEKLGFGQFQTEDKRVSGKEIFLNENGILKIHSSSSIKLYIRRWIESFDDNQFLKGGSLDTTTPNIESASKGEILQAWSKYTPSSLGTLVLSDLQVYSEEQFPDTKKLNLFSDDSKTCHIRFKNGVVRITANKIEMIDTETIKKHGAVWESAILPRNIKVYKKPTTGLFEKFAVGAMKRRDATVKTKDWTKEYVMTKASHSQLKGMRTAFGYLIHTYNTPDVAKAIYFIDCDSELGEPKGGNGKSVVMQAIKYYKQTVVQDGKKFRTGAESGKFAFANVYLDTKFILIDDIRPEFSFDMLFSMITGDMEVERKGKDKFTIPSEKKPKLGLTTNYVIAGSGTSYKRRQHIVEFGNYWNRCNEEKESPSDKKHLGKMLFNNFDEKDWNEFYNYGFNCVQEYLKEGLVESPHSDIEKKVLKATIEGATGDGAITGFIEEWIRTDRLTGNYHKGDGISEDDFYEKFLEEYPTYAVENGGIWDKQKINTAVFQFAMGAKGMDYNPHLANKGDSKSQRRWKRGSAGNQKVCFRITTDIDKEFGSTGGKFSKSKSGKDDDEDTMKYFEKLAKRGV